MGTKFFHPSNPAIGASNLNLEARSQNTPIYAGRTAAAGAQKDLAAASALAKGVLKRSTKSAASDAPGPKRV